MILSHSPYFFILEHLSDIRNKTKCQWQNLNVAADCVGSDKTDVYCKDESGCLSCSLWKRELQAQPDCLLDGGITIAPFHYLPAGIRMAFFKLFWNNVSMDRNNEIKMTPQLWWCTLVYTLEVMKTQDYLFRAIFSILSFYKQLPNFPAWNDVAHF